jgi:HPt (histidine-containing phosphotransfer) domain-containing protein
VIDITRVNENGEHAAETEASSSAVVPPMPDLASLPSVDDEQLESIRKIVSQAVFVDLIGSFLEGAVARVERVEQLIATGEIVELSRNAHDLVSMAGNFGACRLALVARRIETAARNQRPDLVAELVPTLVRSANDAFAIIRARLQALATSTP